MKSMKKSGRPIGTTGKARAISDKELGIVLKVTERSRYARRNVAVLVLSHYLGLRAKELASLRVSDVYDGQGIVKMLRLVSGYTKGGVHRDISLENKKVTKALEDYIDYRKSGDGLAFNLKAPLFRSNRGTAFSANSMSRLFIILYSDAGIDNASSHTGRRSLITKLAYAGIDVNSIRQIAGHKSIITTQTYIDDNPGLIRDILINI